jgi:methionyl-tRNA formyltransferase
LLVAEEAAGVQALRVAAGSSHELVAVMTSQGGQRGHGAAVREAATRWGYQVWPAEWVKDPGFAARMRTEAVDVLLNVHSLFVIHPEVLAAPFCGAYNMHPGPLPEYAGLNPVCWALYAGELRHAVTVHRMVPQIDAGPIAYQSWFPIEEQDSALTVSVKCTKAGVPLIAELLTALAEDQASIPEVPQDLGRRHYYGKEVPNAGQLDWSWPARQVVNFVRACDYLPFESPWGHPTARLERRELFIVNATRTGERSFQRPGTVGQVVGGAAMVATADEWVLVHRVLSMGRVVEARDALAPGRRFDDYTPVANAPGGRPVGERSARDRSWPS